MIKLYEKFFSVFELNVKLPRHLKNQLERSGLDLDEKQFFYLMLGNSLSFLIVSFIIFYVISLYSISIELYHVLFISLFCSALAFFHTYRKPLSLAIEKEKEIDANLVFVGRELYVSFKTGSSLNQALRNVAVGNYGFLSDIFQKILQEIERGGK